MAWTLTEDLDEYVVAAGDFLRSRPVHNTVQLAAVETLRARGGAAFGEIPSLFGWWRSSDGEVAAALLHTPPYPVLLARLPEHSAGPLAEVLSASRRQLAGVNAEQGDAAAVAAAGARLCGSGHRSGEPGGAGGWREACGPVHGPGQPDEQRLVPAPGVPAGRGSRRADLRELSDAFQCAGPLGQPGQGGPGQQHVQQPAHRPPGCCVKIVGLHTS